MENVKELWVDKYRPSTLDGYILNEDIKKYFKEMVKGGNLQNFTMIGCAGSGKTTLARILSREFGAETLFVKCATEGTVDTLRSKIQDFCNTMSFDGRLKLVILDELDSASATSENSFQKGLRTLIESAQANTRFICTANYNKIIPAVLSRCPVVPLKFDKKDLLVHVKNILDAEGVKYGKDSLRAFIEDAFQYYPDCRRIINYLQFCCGGGELVVKLKDAVEAEKAGFIRQIVEMIRKGDNILSVRQFYMKEKLKVDDYMTAASDLFNYVVDSGVVKSADGIIKLTDMMFYVSQVIDKESMFFGMLTAVSKYAERT